jgi:hypothetical protein
MRERVRRRGWLVCVCLTLALAAWVGGRPASAANAFGLVLDLKQTGRVVATRMILLTSAELEMPRALGPVIGPGQAGGLAWVPVDGLTSEPSAWERVRIERSGGRAVVRPLATSPPTSSSAPASASIPAAALSPPTAESLAWVSASEDRGLEDYPAAKPARFIARWIAGIAMNSRQIRPLR